MIKTIQVLETTGIFIPPEDVEHVSSVGIRSQQFSFTITSRKTGKSYTVGSDDRKELDSIREDVLTEIHESIYHV